MKLLGLDTVLAGVIWALAILGAASFGIYLGSMNREGNPLVGLIVFGGGALIGGAIYLAPIWISAIRDSRYRMGIMILVLVSLPLDFLLGFGVLLWLFALIWAISSPCGAVVNPPPVYVINHVSPPPLPQSLPPLPGSRINGVGDELGKLIALRDSGELTADEFNRQRARLLGA